MLPEVNIDLNVPIKNRQQLEDELERLVEIIQSAAHESSPIIQNNKRKEKTYPVEVREYVR